MLPSCHAPSQLPPVDVSKRYVRVRNRLDNGLIEFDFAIGWPELNVELLLPPTAFNAFCAANKVEFLPPAD
ncbi:MAG TPA: phenol hydroxylase subunit [Pusillimonas sp.]|uniref:phenol hydroxylase subunit n=1 Tax=Pusillimonas sp. TaxID=3040095 RepID=UPI002C0F0DAD|nr:phenol hydroxylase subunit [Pusillimonas sp.]HUH88634.1 phenol hydroxylase subunit [Pusillimonas sp.]